MNLVHLCTLFLIFVFLNCSNSESLYDAKDSHPITIYSGIILSDSNESSEFQTKISYLKMDTIQPNSTCYLGFRIGPEEDEQFIQRAFWRINDSILLDEAAPSFSPQKRQLYQLVLFVIDLREDTLYDTSFLLVDTPPDSVQLISPYYNQFGVAPDSSNSLQFNWSIYDSDLNESFFSKLYFAEDSSKLWNMAIDSTLDSSITQAVSLKSNQQYWWGILVQDSLGLQKKSTSSHFTTRNFSTDSSSISGMISRNLNTDSSGILVQLIQNTDTLQTTSNQHGYWEFNHIDFGEYKLLITDPFYSDYSQFDSSILIPAGTHISVPNQSLNDLSAPLAVLSAPSETVRNSRSPQFNIFLSDHGSGIDPTSIAVRIDGTAQIAHLKNSIISWNSSTLYEDGVHSIQINLSDLANNNSDAILLPFEIKIFDFNLPSDTTISGYSSFQWNAENPNIKQFDWTIDSTIYSNNYGVSILIKPDTIQKRDSTIIILKTKDLWGFQDSIQSTLHFNWNSEL